MLKILCIFFIHRELPESQKQFFILMEAIWLGFIRLSRMFLTLRMRTGGGVLLIRAGLPVILTWFTGPCSTVPHVFMYEGAPTFPYPNRWWNMIEKYSISILYTAPTAVRGLMRFGEAWPNRHDLSSLRLLGSVGEPINPEAWKWYHRVIGKGNCPIMDTWWQTETGMFIITPTPDMPLKPGSGNTSIFWYFC